MSSPPAPAMITSPTTAGGKTVIVESDEEMSRLIDDNLSLTETVTPPPPKAEIVDDKKIVPDNTNVTKTKSVLERMKAKKSEAAGLTEVPERQQAPVPVQVRSHQQPQVPVPPPVQRKIMSTVTGSNIGSSANEPNWTNEQLRAIQTAISTRLPNEVINDTRRSVMDKDKYYLTTGSNGSIVAKTPSYLPIISTNDYMIGCGKAKPDLKTGKSRVYSDVVMIGRKDKFVANQWTSMNVVMEGVPNDVLNKPPRLNASGKADRRIGHDFARIGLPKSSFGPIFETLRMSMPSLHNDITSTAGYYWMNASWGVTSSPGTFVYLAQRDQPPEKTQRLYDAMKRIMGSSSEGVATVAISMSDETVMQNGVAVASGNKQSFSIKLHNFFHLKNVPYRSPPQSSATGFEITDDMYNMAEVLSAPSASNSIFADNASMLTPGTINPFASMTQVANSSANTYEPTNMSMI